MGKKPLSAYLLFSQEEWQKDTTRNAKDVATEVRTRWNNMSVAEKKPYEEKHAAQMKAWEKEQPPATYMGVGKPVSMESPLRGNTTAAVPLRPMQAETPASAPSTPSAKAPSAAATPAAITSAVYPPPKPPAHNSLKSAEQGELYGDASVFTSSRLDAARAERNERFVMDIFVNPLPQPVDDTPDQADADALEARLKQLIEEEQREIAKLKDEHAAKKARLMEQPSVLQTRRPGAFGPKDWPRCRRVEDDEGLMMPQSDRDPVFIQL